MAHASPDVLVVGGGPAGAAAASLLAQWGHRVALVTKAHTSRFTLAESIPPSTRKLCDVIGVSARLDAAGFIRSGGNTAWWGGAAPRVEGFAEGTQGWQVTSHALENVLLEHACAAGVQVERARVDAAAAVRRDARFVLDCSGRAGVVARARKLRVYEWRHRTIAMIARWRAPGGFGFPDPTHTVIESYDGGWAWSVPTGIDERHVAVMVDPRTSQLPRATQPVDTYREQLARTRHIGGALAEAILLGNPAGWDASMYHAGRYVDDNVLLVGDAGSFIDPLSSAGVKKAFASGWLAAVAVNTALVRPAMRTTALAFFEQREREVYTTLHAMSLRFFSEAASGHPDAFWAERVQQANVTDEDADVSAAFARLRVEPALRVGPGSTARVEPRPAVQGSQITLEPRLVDDRFPDGLRWLHGVDMLALIHLAPTLESVPALFAAYNHRHAAVAFPDFLLALSTALARRWLLWL